MRRLAALIALAALLAAPAARAQTIKLGTLAPDGSAWHNLLKEMAQKWSEATGGKVKLKIFAGGVSGNEGDMARKMRVGQLQAAAISVIGLHDIDPSPQAVACPGLIADQAEFDHVFATMQPVWEKRFLDKGYVVLMWGDTGTVYLFFDKPVKTVAEMAGVKIFAWSGDPESVKGWELAGFRPVVISSTDILPSLSTGMIDGFATSPIMAFTARWFERAKNVPDITWGHLPGATVVLKETWDKIPAEDQPKLRAIAAEYGKRVNAEVMKMQSDAIAEMKKAGLTLIPFEGQRAAFLSMAEKTWGAVRGGVINAEDFDAVKKVRDDYRAAKEKK